MNTAVTHIALDEYGHPIRQADGQYAKTTSSPKQDFTRATTITTLPLMVLSGPASAAGALAGGAVGGLGGHLVGNVTSAVLDVDPEAQEMLESVGSFAGGLVGAGKGFNFGNKVQTMWPT